MSHGGHLAHPLRGRRRAPARGQPGLPSFAPHPCATTTVLWSRKGGERKTSSHPNPRRDAPAGGVLAAGAEPEELPGGAPAAPRPGGTGGHRQQQQQPPPRPGPPGSAPRRAPLHHPWPLGAFLRREELLARSSPPAKPGEMSGPPRVLRGGRGVGSSESLAAVSDYRLAGGRVLGRGLGEGLRPADVFVSQRTKFVCASSAGPGSWGGRDFSEEVEMEDGASPTTLTRWARSDRARHHRPPCPGHLSSSS